MLEDIGEEEDDGFYGSEGEGKDHHLNRNLDCWASSLDHVLRTCDFCKSFISCLLLTPPRKGLGSDFNISPGCESNTYGAIYNVMVVTRVSIATHQ